MTRRSTPGLTFGHGSASPRARGYRMPAEWEPHAATWLVWPHNRADFEVKTSAVDWVLRGDRPASGRRRARRDSFPRQACRATSRSGARRDAESISGASTGIVCKPIAPGFGTPVRFSLFGAGPAPPAPLPRPIGVSTGGRATGPGNVTTHSRDALSQRLGHTPLSRSGSAGCRWSWRGAASTSTEKGCSLPRKSAC